MTGASRGLGGSIATKLDDAGYFVCNASRETNVDVTIPKTVERFVEGVLTEHGRIDVLVNNAGYCHERRLLEWITLDEFYRTMEANLMAPFMFMQHVVPVMKRQGSGVIVNIASKSSVYAVPTLSVYSGTKAALVSLTQAVAKELRDGYPNILCVAVSPAGMNTLMRQRLYGDAEKQMSVDRVSDVVVNIVERRTAASGVNLIVRKEKMNSVEMEDDSQV